MSIDENVYFGSYLWVDTKKNLYEVMEKKLSNGDFFIDVKIDGVAGRFLIPNRSDPTEYGGIRLRDHGSWDCPKPDFSHKDWQTVKTMLMEEKISFKERCGLVLWYN